MVAVDLSLHHRWTWFLIIMLTEKEGYSITEVMRNFKNISTASASNEGALLKIEEVLLTINTMKLSPVYQHLSNTTEQRMIKEKSQGLFNVSDEVMPLIMLKQLSQLCKILNPSREQTNWIYQHNYAPMISEPHMDRFGCKKLWGSAVAAFSKNENSSVMLDDLHDKLNGWREKLQMLPASFSMPAYPTFSVSQVSNRPPEVYQHSTPVNKLPDKLTSNAPVLRWNKGLTRYDNTWSKTDTKHSDKEIVFYDSFDPSKKEDGKLSVGKFAIRVLPALTVIIFLIFCWYFFVYRRMKQRQQRARALLNQYQAILSGTRALSGSVMIVSNSAHNDNAVRMFGCSSSTYDSCLNDACNAADSANCAEHCSASTVPASCNSDRHCVPTTVFRATSTRPSSYPPMYEEIFPPTYDSIYGTLV